MSTLRRLERDRHGCFEREGTSVDAAPIEIRSSDLANPSFTLLTMTAPATEWRADLLALDSSPQSTSAFGLTASCRHGRKDSDVEDAP